jgi:hypothetical protein
MRARSHILNVGLVVMSAFLLVMAGCGGDDSTTVTGGTGSTEPHVHYYEVQEQLEDFAQSAIALVGDGLSMSAVSSDGLDDIVFGSQNPDSSYTGDWQIFFLGEVSTTVWGLDSIQFQKDFTPQPTALGADRILFKHQYRVTNSDTTVTHTNYELVGDLDLRDLDGNTANITGTYQNLIQSKYVGAESTEWWEFDMQGTFTAYTVNKDGDWAGGCPNSATCNLTVNVSHQEDTGAPVVSSWQITATFIDGTMQVQASVDQLDLQYAQQICNAN